MVVEAKTWSADAIVTAGPLMSSIWAVGDRGWLAVSARTLRVRRASCSSFVGVRGGLSEWEEGLVGSLGTFGAATQLDALAR